MSKRTLVILTVIIIGLAIVVGGGWLVFSSTSLQPAVEQTGNSNSNSLEAVENRATLLINYGDKEEIFQVNFDESATVFDVLKNKATEMGLNFKTKEYDFGVLIEAIGEKENGQGGKYWLYYVNGEMPMVSADKTILKPGDKVEFKFEKSLF